MGTISTKHASPDAVIRMRARAAKAKRKKQAEAEGELANYRFRIADYITERLGWTPWASGDSDRPGQLEIIESAQRCLKAQHERRAYQRGEIAEDDLEVWSPGEIIQTTIRVPAGHNTGKTKLASGLVNHFFDTFSPSIIYSYAPSWEQIHDLLWKEIKADRKNTDLPGRILDLELNRGPNHFAKGRATSNMGGAGTERLQGQHAPYIMHVIDEAVGVQDFVYDAVESMSSGGIVMVLMLANPRTRACRFYRERRNRAVKTERISCLYHPNVLAGYEKITGSVSRSWVEGMIEKHCEPVVEDDPDAHTFTLPFDVKIEQGGQMRTFEAGQVFRPNAYFQWRVLGIAPAEQSDKTLVPVGRYEKALERAPDPEAPKTWARIGVDVARDGTDYGTVYVQYAGALWRARQLFQKKTYDYLAAIREVVEELDGMGVYDVEVRVDGTGGWGAGLVDTLRADLDLKRMFDRWKVIEVQFGASPDKRKAYANRITELYAHAGEAMKELAVRDVPSELEGDLCERTYEWASWKRHQVKRLTKKDAFKKEKGRSPDDGDGCVLATAPDHLFSAPAGSGGGVIGNTR